MDADLYNTGYEIIAYITLNKDRSQNGSPLISVANNLEEQKTIDRRYFKSCKSRSSSTYLRKLYDY